jgi:hypothetical protein
MNSAELFESLNARMLRLENGAEIKPFESEDKDIFATRGLPVYCS